MNDNRILGVGNTAEVYNYGENKVCKLFFKGYPYEYVNLEYKNSIELLSLGLDVPKVYEVICENGRYGIVYERIEGKTLLELIQDDDIWLDKFVDIHKDIISRHTRNVLSYKDFWISMLKMKKVDDEKMIADITALPNDDCLLHGDFHPGNILIKEDGTCIIIDFLNVCYGTALYDVARTFFLIRENDDNLARRYLKKMSVDEEKIVKYLAIIERCRTYE